MSTPGGLLQDSTFAGAGYASANFSDDNVSGSGLAGSPYIRMMDNLSTAHMNDASASVIPWKETLDRSFEVYGEEFLNTMVKPVEQLDRVKQLHSLVDRLAHPMFNPSSSWIAKELTSPIQTDSIQKDIRSAIGLDSTQFHVLIESMYRKYSSTVQKMFEMDATIHTKLKQVQALHTHLISLPALSEENIATKPLQESITNYTGTMLEALKIHEEYPVFLHTVGVFQELRSLLKLGRSDSESKPSCTICMTNPIDSVLVPCGHAFCKDCSQKTRSTCFLCRTNVFQKQRIFL